MAIKYNLNTSIDFRGIWWLPELPERQIPGTLKFDGIEKCYLCLEGALSEHNWGGEVHNDYPIIFGETTNGEVCSLFDTQEYEINRNLIGPQLRSLVFNKMFIGKRTFNPEHELVESVIIKFSNFSYWMSRNPIEIDHKRKIKNIPEGKITYKLPKDIVIWVNPLDAYIRLEGEIDTISQYQKVSVSMDERIRIVPKTKKRLEWFLKAICKLRILLGIFWGNSINIESLVVCPGRKKTNISPSNKQKLIREEIFCLLRQFMNFRKKEIQHSSEIPFTFCEIGKNGFSKALHLWYKNTENLETTSSLHFASSINSQMPTEFHYLTMIQALEAYDRAKGKGIYMDEKKFKVYRDTLIKAIPTDLEKSHRESLKSRIKYGYEFSLRKRFAEMLKQLPEAIRVLITENDPMFTNKVIDTRNHLIHRDHKSIGKYVMNSTGVFNYTEKLRLLIEYYLLMECGIEKQLIIKTMTTHRAYRRPNIA